MNRKDIKTLVVVGIVLLIILVCGYLLYKKDKTIFTPTKMKDIQFKNIGIVNNLNSKEQEELKQEITDYLNELNYSYYDKVIFKTTDTFNNQYYIYFYINNDDKSLFECADLKNGYKIYFLGDEIDPYYKSEMTNMTYNKIMHPNENSASNSPSSSYQEENEVLEKEILPKKRN